MMITKLAFLLFIYFQCSETARPEGIVVIGGDDKKNWSSSMEYYYPSDPEMNCAFGFEKWNPRHGHTSSMTVNDIIVIVGGKVKDHTGIVNISNTVWAFDTELNKLSPGEPMKQARYEPSSAFANELMYVCGGISPIGTCYNSCEVVGGETSWHWKFITPMREARADFSLVAVRNQLYAIGGVSYDDNPPLVKPIRTVERYNPLGNSTEKWTPVAPLLWEVGMHAASVLDNHIYVCGGYINGENDTNLCQRYDPSNNKWSKVANMNQHRSRFAMVALEGKIYALGSRFLGLPQHTVEMYDPDNNTWTMKKPLIHAKGDFSANVV